jgi:small conductance mechanosensitive channel
MATKADEAASAKTDVKVALIDQSTQLASERTVLADRLKLVLDKWELKGGDPTEYRQYIASLGGFKIDVSDQTATWARAKAWLIAEEGGFRWARNLGIFLGYVLGSIALAWIARKILRRVMSVTNVSSKLLRDFVVAMSGRAIVFVGVLLGLSALEINLAPILAVVGAAGFVVAFALQGTLSNFASGLLIMVNKPFDVGDHVEIGSGIKGKVQTVSIFSTLIEADDGLRMVVPNNTVWSGVIINRSTGLVSNDPAAGAAAGDAKPA